MASKCFKIFFFCILSVQASAQFKLYEKGHDSYTSGKYDEAITNFSQYLTKPTRDKSLDVEVYYLRALSYYKTNDFKNAIPDFEETILLDHKNKGNIYWFMAKGYEKMGNSHEAVAAYNNALRELNESKETKAKLYYDRSQLHSKTGEHSLAYNDLKIGNTLHPGNPDIKRELEKLEKQGIVGRSTTDAPVETTKNDDKKNDPVVTGTSTNSGTTAKNDVAKEGAPPQSTKVITTATTTAAPSAIVANSLAEFYKDEKRFALVIGNSNYPKSIGALKNPVNDATDFAKELQLSNFDVQLLTNATYGQMRAAMLKFKEKVDASEREKTVALFYFAGHGLRHEDENYLVPIDAMVEFEDDIPRYCFAVQRMVLANMERSNSRMNIVILDACRNNPFPALTRSLGEQGLGDMRRARGSFMAFATAPGSVASDGVGRNGLYTQELIKAVAKPGLTIEQVFKEVRANVLRLSGNKQNTWDSSNIIGEFYFRF
ncbi:MAG TPA: caspase family protein [Chryseolinea sp.]|nr:caspase family protein [Chryseolinea sp.]